MSTQNSNSSECLHHIAIWRSWVNILASRHLKYLQYAQSEGGPPNFSKLSNIVISCSKHSSELIFEIFYPRSKLWKGCSKFISYSKHSSEPTYENVTRTRTRTRTCTTHSHARAHTHTHTRTHAHTHTRTHKNTVIHVFAIACVYAWSFKQIELPAKSLPNSHWVKKVTSMKLSG